MSPTNNEVNPCKYLRGPVMALLSKYMKGDPATFQDESALDSLLEPLPELIHADLRRDFMRIVAVWRNVQIHGKKCSYTSINRRTGRLHVALAKRKTTSPEWGTRATVRRNRISSKGEFQHLFAGNDPGHYVWNNGAYDAVDRGITQEDVTRHLRGELPALLSIPIMQSGLVHFACMDCDRHGEGDVAIDHKAVALKISELGLPLIICRSKSPKSAHIWLFFKERDGFDAATARRLVEKYTRVLGIGGTIEIFPKQEALKEGQLGSGINLPYFSGERVAFGADGEALDLEGFIAWYPCVRHMGEVGGA